MPLKILLADDSSTAQKLGEKFLEGAGHSVITVSNGAQALKKINSEKPDLAVLDIFMPGYNGLEVCEKIRAVAETANLPVILTVGKMEHYKPEDAERAKAEGVIVKPFEEKDLLAAVKKIEDKLAAAVPAYEATQKLAPVAEIKDASYEEWKISAPDEEPSASTAVSVPDHMASAPAFGMDMLGEVSEPTQEFTAPTQEITLPDAGRITRALEMSGTAIPHREPEVDFTSPPREASSHSAAGAPSPGQDPALVTDRSEMVSAFPTKFGNFGDEISVGVAADVPGVYDDAAAAAPAEAEGAAEPTASTPAPAAEDEFEARVRAAMSSYETEAPAAAPPDESAARAAATASYDFKTTPTVEPLPPPPPPGWMAEEETLSTGEASLSLDQEMQRTFAAVAVEEEPPPPPPVEEAPAPPLPLAAAAAAPVENKPDAELAAAMSAAMGSEVTPAAATPSATTTVDANTIAMIVHRVTERMKPQLIEEIARELAAEAERMKK